MCIEKIQKYPYWTDIAGYSWWMGRSNGMGGKEGEVW